MNKIIILLSLLLFAGCSGGEKKKEAVRPDTEKPVAKEGEASPPQTAGTGALSGTVKWVGDLLAMQELNMSADPTCVSKYEGAEKPVSEALVLGSGSTMANVVVKVKSGIPAGQTFAPPSSPVVITQNGCMYHPHVFGVMTNQEIKFVNGDGILHNVHALPAINRQFNISMPKTMTESPPKKFSQAECVPFNIKCDIHPWMLSYACVMDHPFFAVTKPDGGFSITGLPAGTYEVEAWHEKAGTRTASVTLAEGETKTVDFIFSK